MKEAILTLLRWMGIGRPTVEVGDVFVLRDGGDNPFERFEYEILEVRGGFVKYLMSNNKYPKSYTKSYTNVDSTKILDFQILFKKIRSGDES